ncbi:bactofilin family protein [Paenibacillus agricola]|uniref:Polymer-forming cytoskeletal protein n=1 Tax=Paenibacillus agricola TaxID=2716264 RepID=A0ABX0J072_9BACL|nr:polymer-forming cytoskeletal protein [Paenibacillus agricola]NHN29363.1 polymer-forming cytoskeletal protein [Paenibacillus agricola]
MMFRGKKHALDVHVTDTLIGEGTLFEGKIKSEASIRIEGQITGDVDCAGDVTIGEHGIVKSNVIARNVILAGTVNGNIMCKGKLMIHSTGKLYGNTTAQSLVIAEGGVFQGASKMDTGDSISVVEKQESESEERTAASLPNTPTTPTVITWQ